LIVTCASERATSTVKLYSPPGSILSFVVEADVCPSGGLFFGPFSLECCVILGAVLVPPARKSEPRLFSNCVRRLVRFQVLL